MSSVSSATVPAHASRSNVCTLDSSPALTSSESHLIYRFPKPDIHGRMELLLTHLELLEAVAKFVPSPYATATTLCRLRMPGSGPTHVGALGRTELVPEAPAAEGDVASPSLPSESAPAPASPARIRWAVLLARIYDVLPLPCPACGG